MSSRTSSMPVRASSLARAVSGALWLPRGIAFLVLNPRLWPLVVLPAVIAGFLLVGGLLFGLWAAPFVEERLVGGGSLPKGLELLSGFLIWMATLSAGAALGFGLALLLVAPILDQISRRVERIVRGAAGDRGSGLAWEVKESLRGSFYFLAAAPGILLLAFIPIVGPALAVLWAGFALSFQFSDPPLTRRGLGFRQKRAWHRRYRPEAVGFGIAGLFTLLIPFADLFAAPALAVGATLLVLRLEDRDGDPEWRETLAKRYQ
jgi:CysZ protein